MQINEAEPEDGYEVEIEMLTEVPVPGGARIKSIVDAGKFWILLDEAGSLIHVTVPEISVDCMEFKILWSFHSGGISKAVLDSGSHSCVTVDKSGSIWSYDLRSRKALAKRQFPQGITCMLRAPVTMDPNQRVFLLGHDHGFVRQVVRCSDGWRLAACFRAHKSAVLALCSSPSGGEVVSCGSDCTLFFFTINNGKLQPLAFTLLPHSPTAVVWTSQGVIVGCDNGTLLCVAPPKSHDHMAATTYEFKADISQHSFILPKSLWPPPPKKAPQDDEKDTTDDQGM
jgi:WD40 repeat protein